MFDNGNSDYGMESSNSSKESGTPSTKKLSLEICRLHADNIRLRENMKSMEDKLEETNRILASRDKEVTAISSLYSETDKLYEKERQRCRELRTEISSLKQFLREAEDLKAEAIVLRKEMDDMKSIKKLISASEDSARDLLSRYTTSSRTEKPSTSRTQPPSDLASLCKWAAVLRTELTASRDKARSYRSELARIRKFQITASQRIAKAESKVDELKEYASNLEKQLSTVMSHCQTTSAPKSSSSDDGVGGGGGGGGGAINSIRSEDFDISTDLFNSPPNHVTNPTPGNDHTTTDMIDLTTPDLLSISPSEDSSNKLSAKLRTPSVNPFGIGATDRAGPTHLTDVTNNSKSFKPFLFSPLGSTNSTTSRTNTPIMQRRPSTLYQMAIMRQHAQAPSYATANMAIKSDLLRSNQSYRQMSAPSASLKSAPDPKPVQPSAAACAPSGGPGKRNVSAATRPLKRSSSDMTKSSKLDGFVLKL